MCGLQAHSSLKREGCLVCISNSSRFRTRRTLFLLVAEHNLHTLQGDAADPRLCYFHPGRSEGEGRSSCANLFTSILLFLWREPHIFPQTWFFTGLGCWATLFS